MRVDQPTQSSTDERPADPPLARLHPPSIIKEEENACAPGVDAVWACAPFDMPVMNGVEP
jgi:hypothetical protein